MIRIAVLDDDPREAEITGRILSRCTSENKTRPTEIKLFSAPWELLEEVEAAGGYDIYFLDIIMPVISGIEVAERLRARREKAAIVFLTVSKEYGVDAFGVEAAGYLVKPFSENAVRELINKIYAGFKDVAKPLYVKISGGFRKIIPDEIVMIESFNHYREIFLSSGESVSTPLTLEELKARLSALPQFYSPHRAYIVNLDFVTGIKGRDIYLPSDVVPVSKKSYPEFREYYFDRYLGGRKGC